MAERSLGISSLVLIPCFLCGRGKSSSWVVESHVPRCSGATTPSMEVAVMLPGRSRAAAGLAGSKDTLLLWGSWLHLKQVALSKAHVLKSHENVDGKG